MSVTPDTDKATPPRTPDEQCDPISRRALLAAFHALEDALERDRVIEVRVEPARVSCSHEHSTSGIVFLPTTVRIDARYRDVKDGHHFFRRVVAFDGCRSPLVIGDRGLEPADLASNFAGIVELDDANFAVVPGGGWVVKHRGGDGSVWTSPVIAWQIDSTGSGVPIVSDGDGYAEPQPFGSAEIVHPDATESPVTSE